MARITTMIRKILRPFRSGSSRPGPAEVTDAHKPMTITEAQKRGDDYKAAPFGGNAGGFG
ncbi:MAG: hypothetical protein S0880_23265 [Actinomycetota bacterium]|nr:hypothetical protein [Actinomycetota bacterium]